MPTCKACGDDVSWFEWRSEIGLCSACQAKPEHTVESVVLDQQVFREIILTTETAHNLPVTERLGIVTAECVFGMHIFKDLFTAGRDLFGGRSATMQNTLKDARNTVLKELREEAIALGADAVVGVDLDYSEISGGGKSMLFLVASGTAVKLAV